MKKTKKIITALTAIAIMASMGAASAAEPEISAAQPVETKMGVEGVFNYVFHVAKNLVKLSKDGEDETITFTVAEDASYVVTKKDVKLSSTAEEQGETVIYDVSVDESAAKDIDISSGAEDNEQGECIIKMENGKTLVSSDNGETWVEVEIQTEKSM